MFSPRQSAMGWDYAARQSKHLARLPFNGADGGNARCEGLEGGGIGERLEIVRRVSPAYSPQGLQTPKALKRLVPRDGQPECKRVKDLASSGTTKAL